VQNNYQPQFRYVTPSLVAAASYRLQQQQQLQEPGVRTGRAVFPSSAHLAHHTKCQRLRAVGPGLMLVQRWRVSRNDSVDLL